MKTNVNKQIWTKPTISILNIKSYTQNGKNEAKVENVAGKSTGS
jgi:hypothetical protein